MPPSIIAASLISVGTAANIGRSSTIAHGNDVEDGWPSPNSNCWNTSQYASVGSTSEAPASPPRVEIGVQRGPPRCPYSRLPASAF